MAYVILMSPLSSRPSTSTGRRVQICGSGYHNRLAHRAVLLFKKRLYLLRFAALILPAPAYAASNLQVLKSDGGLSASLPFRQATSKEPTQLFIAQGLPHCIKRDCVSR